MLKLTDSGFALGLLAACQFGPVLVLGAWAGLVADRSDKRKLLMIVQSFAMLQSFALAFIAFMDNPPVAAIYLVALFGGVATAFDNPARRAYVVEMVPEANVQNAVSLNSALMTGSRVVGPALAGLLITTVGYGWTFAVDGVSYLAVILGLFMMRTSENRPHARHPPRQGPGPRRVALRPHHARAVGAAGDDGDRRHVRLQLPDGDAAAGQAHAARHRPHVHADLLASSAVGSLAGALLSARRSTISVRHIVVVGVRLRCVDVAARRSPRMCR